VIPSRVTSAFVLGLVVGAIAATLAWAADQGLSHRPGLHKAGTLETPLDHWRRSLAGETNAIRASKCYGQIRVRPLSEIPVGLRKYAVRQWLERLDDARRAPVNPNASVGCAIAVVFGPYAGQAMSVSWCESRWKTWARNGQYLGLFQMGARERATYGHGSTALEQARAAWRYFDASGRDWSPWQCRPGGRLAW
jgi:hypothetical protein